MPPALRAARLRICRLTRAHVQNAGDGPIANLQAHLENPGEVNGFAYAAKFVPN